MVELGKLSDPEFCRVRWTATYPEAVEPHGVRGPHVCAKISYPSEPHETHSCCCGATLKYEVRTIRSAT